MLPLLLIAISALLSLACLHAATLVVRWRSAPSAEAMTLLLGVEALWAGAYAAELAASSIGAKLLWDGVQGLPAMLAPFAALGLAWRQRGGERGFSRAWLAAGAIAGTALMLLRLTDARHGLTRLDPRIDGGPALPVLEYGLSRGEVLAHSAAIACVLTAVVLLAHGAIVERGSTRRQLLELLVCSAPAALSGVLELSRVRVFGLGDTTPLWFGVAYLASAWSSFPRRLLDLGPMARRVLVAQLPDPVLVLDRWGRIVERNLAAERLLGRGADVGCEVVGVLPALEQVLGAPAGHPFELERGARRFECRWVALTNPVGERRGVVVMLRDVTPDRGADRRLLDTQRQLDRRARERTAEVLASEARLRAFFERSRPALFVDLEGRVLDANRAARESFDLDHDGLLGTAIDDALMGDRDRASRTRDALQLRRSRDSEPGAEEQESRALVRSAVARAAKGELVRVELDLPSPSAPRLVELSFEPVSEAGGARGVLLVELHDRADRRGSKSDMSRRFVGG